MKNSGKYRSVIFLCAVTLTVFCTALFGDHGSRRGHGDKEIGKDRKIPQQLLLADIKIGPFYLKPTLALKNVGWDSNVFSKRADKVSSFTATLSSTLLATLPIRRNRFDFKGDWGLVYYQALSDANAVNSDYRFKYTLDLERLDFSVHENFVNRRDTYNYEIDEKIRWKQNQLFARAHWDLSSKSSLTASGEHSIFRLNREEYAGSIDWTYQILPQTRFLAGWNYRRGDFQMEESKRDYNSYRAYAGLVFDEGAFFTGTVEGGYYRFDSRAADRESYAGFGGSLDLIYKITELMHVRFRAKRELFSSSYRDNNYFINDFFSLSVTRYLPERISVLADFAYVVND